MKSIHPYFLSALFAAALMGNYGCQQAGGNSTGSEFIPDMAHAVSYEANVSHDYIFNIFDKNSTFTRRHLSVPRQPVNGTIPRGYTGIGTQDVSFVNADAAAMATQEKMKSSGGIVYTPNGSVNYYYPDTEDGRNLAIAQIKYNPFPITKDGLERGKELYNIYCGVCHGKEGDGNGVLLDGGKYAPQPANFTDSLFVFSSNGRYYHSIIYGKNLMSGYSDKLGYEERWQVIHYIRSLQATKRKVKYNEEVNELRADYGVPAARVKQLISANLPPQTELPPATPPKEKPAGGAHGH